MVSMSIEVDDRLVKAALGRLKIKLLDWSEAMLAIGTAYKEYMSVKPFASRGSIFGETWPKLDPTYEQWKAKKYPGAPILVATGALSKGFDFTSTSDSMTLSNLVDYFNKHQEGIGVPVRKSLGTNDELKKMAATLINNELARKLAKL